MDKNNPQLSIEWKWRSFDELSTTELYAVLKLRQEIFIVEQKCIYHDCDGLDKKAWHLLGMIYSDMQPELVAYLRLIFPGIKADHPAIGRLLTHERVRTKGVGKQLLRQGVIHSGKTYPDYPIGVSAQVYLQSFYNSFGFMPVSKPYDEDGIAHIDMLRSIQK
jgi:ElaA protein